jgi:Domain of unknown function (DUF4286)
MIIYNVSSKISHRIQEAWLNWMLEEHIPEIMATGLFVEFRLCRLLDQDETEGPTYTVQYAAASLNEYQSYLIDFAPAFREKAYKAWGNQFISFRTLMEVIN